LKIQQIKEDSGLIEAYRENFRMALASVQGIIEQAEKSRLRIVTADYGAPSENWLFWPSSGFEVDTLRDVLGW